MVTPATAGREASGQSILTVSLGRRDRTRNGGPLRPVYGGMRFAILSGVLVPAALATGCLVGVDSHGQIVREDKRFSVTGPPELSLATFDGAIEIRAWESPDVLVEIEKRGATEEAVGALEVRTTQDGNRIEVEVRRPRSESFAGIGFLRSASAKLIVSVPGRSDIRARSGDGSIRIERVSGRIDLHTGDGSIRATEVSGDLVCNTGDGAIVIERADGRLDAHTGDGGVSVSGSLAGLRIRTGDGSIVYRADPGSRMRENWEITTGDGSVTLYLPPDFAAEIDAHTGDGSIRSDLDLPASSRERNLRTLRGRLGEGGQQLRIRTGDGSIRLRVS